MEDEIETQPLRYFSTLYGHEGENSLLSYLASEGLASALMAGEDHRLRAFTAFSVQITLTDKGIEDYQKVIEAVFKYSENIRNEGPRQYIFDEMQALGRA